jgi:Calcineurin-like phosphoesterase
LTSPSTNVARRRVGIGATTAAAQLQKSWPPTVPQPLPAGRGGRAKAADLGVHENQPLTFFVVGDHGGISDPSPQNAVSLAMGDQKLPAFVYSVGDVVYFNADAPQWQPQFVPSGGHLEQSQIAWLTAELAAADPKLPLIVTLHHPPYSVDAHHGGSQKMGAALDSAFRGSGRLPQLVISGHVHDYQRFTRSNLTQEIPSV